MTLSRRLVSLLLIYCFVITVAPHPAIPQSNSIPEAATKTETNPSQITRVFSFLTSSLSPNAETPSSDGDTEEDTGLQFSLSEAAEQPEARPLNKVANSTLLSAAQTEAILRRLPAIKDEPSDETEFALREKSLPPPRTGATMAQSFPAPGEVTAPDQKASGPLEIVRLAPEGSVPIAPNLSVTFSQPMVAISSQTEAADYVPVKLSPQAPGKWHWVGTRTLIFEPDGRFPMATQYSVTVPFGTKSATGGMLALAKTWSFNTPPPAVKTFYPPRASTQRRDTLMFAEFDQRIDPAVVLRTVRLKAGGANLAVRLATAAEIEKDSLVLQLAERAGKDRWLVFRAIDSTGKTEEALPAGSKVEVAILPGTASAEGPRTSTETQNFSFLTFGRLRLISHTCGYEKHCRPSDDWKLEFSNPIDASTFDESKIKIEPAIEGMETSMYGSVIRIEGVKRGRTSYRVTVDGLLRDIFGQTLNAPATVLFNVGAAEPELFGSGSGVVVLDPFGPPRFSVYSVNHNSLKARLYVVTPEDWSRWSDYLRHERSDEANQQKTPPGRQVFSRTIQVRSKPDEMVETGIDLSPALAHQFGQMILIVEPTVKYSRRDFDGSETIETWIQRTDIGLDAFVDSSNLIGWATSLREGAPLPGIELTLLPYRTTATTAADGVARLALQPQSPKFPVNWLVARRGEDVAILPEENGGAGNWYRKQTPDGLRWYVFDDRGLYRPGEEVHLKGWVRRVGAGSDGDVSPLNNAVANVAYVLKDPSGNEISKDKVTLNPLGGFNFVLKLPAVMNLGRATISLKAEGGTGATTEREFDHGLRVAEFRRPEFEVTASSQSAGPLFVGDHAEVSVAAKYFSGGGLPGAPVTWRVTSTPANFTPPNRDDFTFGQWLPFWEEDRKDQESRSETLNGTTDAAGKHRLRIDFNSVKPARPATVTAEAKVVDVNRQTWASTANMLVHPANLYVGLKSERTFVQQGDPIVVQAIVTDLDGQAKAKREVKMRAVLVDWKQVKGEWEQIEVKPQDCLVESAAEAVKCTFAAKEGGTYRVRATVRDERGRANQSELTLWVAGGKQSPERGLDAQKVELVPDRKEYKAGDTAQILVQAPFSPAEAIMTLRRSGIVKTERFRIDGPGYTLRVPIEAAWTPNIHVQVDLVGTEARDSAGKDPDARQRKISPLQAAFASGEINLSIPPLARKLNVTATPREKTLEPGANTTIDVEAKDASGQPIIGEVAVVVVDESVLALSLYKLADPLALFYAQRNEDTSDHHSREAVVLATNPGEFPIVGRGGGVGGGARGFGATGLFTMYSDFPPLRHGAVTLMGKESSEGAAEAIRLRENFNALAVFAPSVRTDVNGKAQVPVKLPDNLTRYRVMAVAVAGGSQFGMGESAITARLPLMARPSAPRFLNFGDTFELPIILQNQTDSPMTVDVAVRASNATLVEIPTSDVQSRPGGRGVGLSTLEVGQNAAGRRVTIPANDRVEVRFPAATVKPGWARFQIGTVSGGWSDAAEVELPVWTPASTEAFATYGVIDDGAIAQPVKAPAGVFTQFGGLEIETSSTQLQELTDAFLYLQNYPYECSEQLASRILSVAALRDVLTAFKAKDLPPREEIEAAVVRDLKRLESLQNNDGGFGFWRRGEPAWPYLSIHVAHALARAREKKFDVPVAMFDRSKKYLQKIESHIPSNYGVDARRAVIAYALYVRNRMGDSDAGRARKLISEAGGLDKLSLEANGWLLSVLSGDPGSQIEVESIRRHLNNRATETAATAHFASSYKDSNYLLLNSDRRGDGVILEALINDQPDNDLIPKIVRGLLANRTRGRWENTQENVFILLALDRYFNTYEKVTPNFVANIWLGNDYAGARQFRGRETDRQLVNVPMSYLAAKSSASSLILSKEGAGRLYYRLGMQYAPLDLQLKPADYGFTVQRSYEAIDHDDDVRRDAEGIWHVKAGARVRVRLTMVAPARRYHVALVDPLPGGFESLNPALAMTESIPEDQKQEGVTEFGTRSIGFGSWRWRPVWFDHQNLRDERAEAFTALLWEGVYNYSYVARATTPGHFVVPPAKAEEMYHPETFGRGKTDRVRIE
jgi:alpha-2-macroglobulin